MTRFKESVESFLDLQNIANIKIEHVNERHLSSFFMPANGKIDIENILFITDDILSPLFVKKRKRSSVSKNLDLLISLLP